MEGVVDHAVAQVGRFFLSFLVADELHADHQPFAAHVADNLEAPRPVIDLAEDVVAYLLGIGHQPTFNQLHGGERRSNTHRIPSVRCSVRAGLPLHDALFRNEGADRHPAGNSLGSEHDVRRDSSVIVRPPLPRAAHSGLHLVNNQHDSVPVADALQFLEEEQRCGDESTFALDRFHDDRGHFFRGKQSLEDLLLEQFNDLATACFLRVPERAAVRVGIRDVLNSSEQRSKSLALRVLRSGQRQRTQCSTVKAAIECDQLVAPRGIARQFNRAFDRLGARIAEEYTVVLRLRHRFH